MTATRLNLKAPVLGVNHRYLEIASRRVIVVFFFQAEDGIREELVTGVQTCALPILLNPVHVVAVVQQSIGLPFEVRKIQQALFGLQLLIVFEQRRAGPIPRTGA